MLQSKKSWDRESCPPYMLPEQVHSERGAKDWLLSYEFTSYALALMEAKRGWPSVITSARTSPGTKTADHHEDDSFENQKRQFQNIPKETLETYQGKFVASRNGIIVDDDTHLASLTRRFREQYGKVPVYITRVGRSARMPTPFLR